MSSETMGNDNISVYPNPSSDVFTVEFNASSLSQYTFKVVDLQGRTILTEEYNVQQGAHQITIDMAGKAKGIYMLHISNSTGTKIQKLILQ